MRRVAEAAVEDVLFVALVDAGQRVVAVQCFVAPDGDWNRVSISEILDFVARRDVTIMTLSRASLSQGSHLPDIVRRLRREGERRAIRFGRHVVVPRCERRESGDDRPHPARLKSS